MKASLCILALLATYATCTVYQIPLNTSVYPFISETETGLSFSNHSTICANISLGTPAQYFNVLLDTISSSFWVAGLNYSGTSGINTFNSTASTTYYSAPGRLGDEDVVAGMYNVFFGASGSMAMDTLQIGNATYYGAVFGEASVVQSPISGVDGILGLGFPQTSLVSDMTSMEQILRDGNFDNVSFSLLYSSISQSYLFLGGINSTYGSDFTYFPLTGNGMWNFIGSIFYGTVPIATDVEFVVDTTSPGLIYLPANAGLNYIEATGLQPDQIHGKDILNWLRELHIVMGDQDIFISPSDFMACNDDDLCEPVIGAQRYRQNSVILGTGFLELFYTHFDYENNRIGFSRRA